MNTQESNDFNWVKARAECNPAFVFDSLYKQVKQDIDQANKYHLSNNCDNEFRFVPKLEDHKNPSFDVIEVSKLNGNPYRDISFIQCKTQIVIVSFDGTEFRIVDQWNSKEQCCDYIVDGEQRMEVWEISKMALEPMFFRNR